MSKLAHHRARAAVVITLCSCLSSTAPSQTLPIAAQAPVAYSNTAAVLAIDMANFELSPSLLKSSTPSVAALAGGLQGLTQWMNGLSDGHTAYVAWDIPYGPRHPVERLVLRKGNNAEEHWKQKSLGNTRVEEDGCWIVTFRPYAAFVPSPVIRESHARLLQTAESTVRDFPVRLLIAPPDSLSDTFEQTMPKLPEELGSLPITVVTRGLRWAAIGLDPATMQLQGTIQSATSTDAQALAEALPELLRQSVDLQSKNSSWGTAILAGALDVLQVDVEDDQIRLLFPGLQEKNGETLFAEIARTIADPVQDSATINRLKAIQLAILNYESANGCFPPNADARGENGRSGLSWRVHVLPYLGKAESELYQQFHLDEPWDSEHNLTLLPKIPNTYQTPKSWVQENLSIQADRAVQGSTTFLAPQGEGTIFGQDEVIRLLDVKDGTSLTLSVVQVKRELAQPWTAPRDYVFDPQNPSAGIDFDRLGMGGGVGCDGAVHALKQAWPAETFLRLFQRNDGQPVSWE